MKKLVLLSSFLVIGITLNAQSALQKALKGKNKEPQEVKQEEVKKPEKPMAVLPTTVYTDKLDISGIYYLSKEVKSEDNLLDANGYASISDPRYFSAVNLQFVEETGALNIHFHDGARAPMKAWLDIMLVKLYKQGNLGDYFGFEVDNSNKTKEFTGGISVLEKDVFIISTSGKYSSDTRLDCSACKLIISKDEAGNENFKREDAYLILGKDKNRVNELMSNPKMVDSLKVITEIGKCEAYNIARAASNVLPVEGLKDAKLKAEATAFAKQEVIANNRTTEKIEYSYIKSKDWIIIRNQSTGLIVKRTLNVITTVKIGDKCFYMNGVMYQLYDGANYGKSQWGGNGAPLATECANLLKYK